MKSLVDFGLVLQGLQFGFLYVDQQKQGQGDDDGRNDQPWDETLAPMGFFLGNQKVKLLFSKGQSS